MIDINTALFLAKERQQTWLTRAAQARLAREARDGRRGTVSRSWHIPRLSVPSSAEVLSRSHNGPTHQPCVTCG